MSSSAEPSSPNNHTILIILDVDPPDSTYRCPFTRCNHSSASLTTILHHECKFRDSNCNGISSPLRLYPALFNDPNLFNNMFSIFGAAYASLEWRRIRQYLHDSDDSEPQIVKLIREFNIFITTNYLKQHPFIMIPKTLQHFIINNIDSFNPKEPPLKKRKVNEFETSLCLPPLNIDNNKCAKFTKYLCNVCLMDINPCSVVIKCRECDDVMFCTMCFKKGNEFQKHKRFHKYTVIPPLKSCQEWRLLNDFRHFKNGNVNSDIEEQFYDKYGDIMYLKQEKHKEKHKYKRKQRQRKGVDINIFCKRNESKFTAKHAAKCGYREYRDEFEAEWNNDAEAMIGDMLFSALDSENERRLKLEGIRIYNDVLKEREIRKQFIKDYGVCYKKRNKRNRNLYNMNHDEMQMEKEITHNLSVFARFTEDKNHNFAEFKDLCLGLIEEYRLRQEIYTFRHYLLNGVTNATQMQNIEKYMNKQLELKQNQYEFQDDDDDDVNTDGVAVNEHQYLNQYNGCSLDAISTYLKLINDNNNNNNNGNINENKSDNDDDDDDDIDIDMNDNGLNEGENKLCKVLKITHSDYEYIQKQISNKVELYGLLNNENIPKQIYIHIDDVKNVKQSMTMRCGLVDAVVLKQNK